MQMQTVAAEQFRRVCGAFVTGITVATAFGADGLPHGITLNSFTSVSLDPPLVLVCIDCRSTFIAHLAAAASFGVNILRDGQEDLSRRFARREADRFSGIDWRLGKSGAPLLPLVLATLECAVAAQFVEGDHYVVVGRVLFANYFEGSPLAYFRGSYRALAEEYEARPEDVSAKLDWSLIIE